MDGSLAVTSVVELKFVEFLFVGVTEIFGFQRKADNIDIYGKSGRIRPRGETGPHLYLKIDTRNGRVTYYNKINELFHRILHCYYY